MFDIILPISFALFATIFLILANSKKNYRKLVENNGEKFAKKINRGLKICASLLLVCSFFWVLIDFI
jgi:hypothetical protein